MGVYVLPSYREGMPRSVLEAMAMGRPVISTRAPGCSDAVEDGYTGLLVPVADSDALAGAMVRLIENPTLAEQMGRAGRRRVVDRFDASRVGEHVARLLVDSSPV
ncbi:MAG: glycosyltransferase family 4 protein [Deltaproteobacteria bacterium]|nr:MAG: glycosyltransferase family 4 protein [Deltaproteobacteria bacterium]